MKTVKLMIGTSRLALLTMSNGQFNQVVWASDNMETVAHYYEGAVVELEIQLVERYRRSYIRSYQELSKYKSYWWGCARMRCPAGATWYSFSRGYLHRYLIGLREIHPDLSPWNED